MARVFHDLPRHYTWLMVGGCCAFMTGMAAIALFAAGFGWMEDKKNQQAEAKKLEPKPPADLARVPEVTLYRMSMTNGQQSRTKLAELVQNIRTEDSQQEDGFVKGLIKGRADLQGLPFRMGGACRMDQQASNAFANAVALTHESLQTQDTTVVGSVDPAARFFDQYGGQDTGAGVAALTQIFGPEKQARREGLAKQLGAVDHPSSTRALARAAVFDFDPKVRSAAIAGLRGRNKNEYTEVLLEGLRHPWAPAAQQAGIAIGRLNRQDMIPQVVAFLAEAAPTDPFEKEVNGKKEVVVREMVKVNHHRNCLLCHSPGQQGQMPGGVFAVVPTPGVAFPAPDSGSAYGGSPGDPTIRADVTYLRQDFSIFEQVANAHPWPETQRFDFMVRTRVLNEEEQQQAAANQKARPAGAISENHKAAARALETLTHKQNIAPTAAAWSEALGIAAPR